MSECSVWLWQIINLVHNEPAVVRNYLRYSEHHLLQLTNHRRDEYTGTSGKTSVLYSGGVHFESEHEQLLFNLNVISDFLSSPGACWYFTFKWAIDIRE
jgi:hypothetical protein